MDKLDIAIERIKEASKMSEFYYKKPLMITYSGGKDSDCILELAKISGIKFEVCHSHTTADAPETVNYVRQRFYELELQGIKCTIEMPYYKGQRISMWSLIPIKKMPPTRLMRYCCEVLKETSGKNRAIVTGVRWDESTKRKSRGIFEDINRNSEKKIVLNNDNDDKRKLFERCELQAKTVCNPIVDWLTSDVWDFLNYRKCPCNPLYKCGFDRVGCVGCPMANKKRYTEFQMWPKYKTLYIHAFDRMIAARLADGKPTEWQNGYEVFQWWMQEDYRQLKFDFMEEGGLIC